MKAVAFVSSLAVAVVVTSPAEAWETSQHTDVMRNEVSTDASITGVTSDGHKLAFTVRKKDKYLFLNALILEDGLQIAPESSGTSTLSLKFDDGPIKEKTFRWNIETSGSVSEIENKPELAQEFANAKRIIVEVPIFHKGPMQFFFSAPGPLPAVMKQ